LRALCATPGYELVGLMSYEGQLAGVGDRCPAPRCAAWPFARCSTSRAESLVSVAPQSSPRFAISHRFNSSTGAAPGRSSPRPPKLRSPKSPPAQGFTGRHCSTPTSTSYHGPRRSSCCRSCDGPRPQSQRLLGGGWIASGPRDPIASPRLPGHSAFNSPPLRSWRGPDAAAGSWRALAARRRQGLVPACQGGELCERIDRLHIVEDAHIANTVATYRVNKRRFSEAASAHKKFEYRRAGMPFRALIGDLQHSVHVATGQVLYAQGWCQPTSARPCPRSGPAPLRANRSPALVGDLRAADHQRVRGDQAAGADDRAVEHRAMVGEHRLRADVHP